MSVRQVAASQPWTMAEEAAEPVSHTSSLVADPWRRLGLHSGDRECWEPAQSSCAHPRAQCLLSSVVRRAEVLPSAVQQAADLPLLPVEAATELAPSPSVLRLGLVARHAQAQQQLPAASQWQSGFFGPILTCCSATPALVRLAQMW